jgi:hypothetical protein
MHQPGRFITKKVIKGEFTQQKGLCQLNQNWEDQAHRAIGRSRAE